MENCLINPSTKKQGWMACDFLGEYVVWEVKNVVPFNINETTGDTLRKIYSSQIMVFREYSNKIHQESKVPILGYHSSPIRTHGDVKRTVDRFIEIQFCKKRVNRHTEDDAKIRHLPIADWRNCMTSEVSKNWNLSKTSWKMIGRKILKRWK